MPETRGKQNYLHGAIILAIATAMVKVIGAIYKIPLGNLLGGEGIGYFYTAYDIYTMLLTVSTAGLPVALSKMIAESEVSGAPGEQRRIFSVAVRAFAIIGLVGTALMFFLAPQLAGDFMQNSGAIPAVRSLAPAVFFVALMAAFRGYFQGGSNMTPTAVSQVLEALCKLIVGFGLAWLMVSAGMGLDIAASGAIIGVSLGTALGAGYLVFRYLRTSRRPREDARQAQAKMRSHGRILKDLVKIAVPVSIGASVLSIINLIDTALVLTRLQSAGFSEEQANFLYGAYSNTKTIFNLPAAFIVPLAVSIIPAITTALAARDRKAVKRTAESSMRITALLAFPAGIGLLVLSWPILNLLFPALEQEVEIGAPLLSMLGIAVMFICIVLLTNAMLQGFGMVNVPVVTMAVGGALKIVSNWVFVGNPDININGAPVGTLICYGTIAVLNMWCISRALPHKISYLRIFARPLIAAALMGGAAWATYGLLSMAVGARVGIVIALLVAVAVYFLLVVMFRAIGYDDLVLLPKGEKIAKILRITGQNEK